MAQDVTEKCHRQSFDRRQTGKFSQLRQQGFRVWFLSLGFKGVRALGGWVSGFRVWGLGSGV